MCWQKLAFFWLFFSLSCRRISSFYYLEKGHNRVDGFLFCFSETFPFPYSNIIIFLLEMPYIKILTSKYLIDSKKDAIASISHSLQPHWLTFWYQKKSSNWVQKTNNIKRLVAFRNPSLIFSYFFTIIQFLYYAM